MTMPNPAKAPELLPPAGYVPLNDVLRIIDMTVLGRVWCRECESYDEECGCGMADESKHVNERHREELKRHIRGLVPPSAPAPSERERELEKALREIRDIAGSQTISLNHPSTYSTIYDITDKALEREGEDAE